MEIGMAAEILPEHMDRWSRNQRLYETLKGMGLFVTAIPEESDSTKIREMVVSADLPFERPILYSAPEAPKVVKADDQGTGNNVVGFPAKP